MEAWHRPLPGGGSVQVRATDRADGDLRVDGDPSTLAARRRGVVDLPWVWLRQVHGADVVVVDSDDDVAELVGTAADALVTTRRDVALAVHGADCGIVAFSSPEGVIGVAHAGWRGLRAGVIGAVAATMRGQGASRIEAVLGPCIGPACYEFAPDQLAELGAALGADIAGSTRWGTPALDLPAALDHALAAADVDVVGRSRRCTACAADELWSFRARRDDARQAVVVWQRPSTGGDE
ncbi:MAG TPA: polyphenol oxidase family protein [Acidimicrobiales bacterium]